MAQRTDIFDLGRLSLHSGEGRRIDTYVTVDPLSFGGRGWTFMNSGWLGNPAQTTAPELALCPTSQGPPSAPREPRSEPPIPRQER